jgi:beta-galactosidase
MNFVQRRCFMLFMALAAGLAGRPALVAEAPFRERLLMDAGWSFHLGNDWGSGQSLAKAGTGIGPASVDYSVASWRKVDLPHDWAIEMPFDPTADGSHGFRAVGRGFPQNSVAWYRRPFPLPAADAGRRLWLEFDGVFRDCTVFVNGWYVGRHESGYSSFRFDITDVAHCGGANVVAVRVDASQPEGWFYEGAGIYRHVWLVKTAPLAVAPDGVFVYSQFRDNIPAGVDTLHLEARLLNSQDASADASVTWEISEPGGRTFTTAARPAHLGPRQLADVDQTVDIRDPQLWSPESPRLYTVVTIVGTGGRIVDRVETPFGIRTFAFDANRGFILNGRPYPLRGTSNHQDHAGVGSALPDGLQSFRIARLKEMGGNAYRTAHNPPTPELLEACDRLGMLVMDENRQLGSDREHLDRWEGQLRRDRCHASVAIWSLGNEEEAVQTTPSGGRVAATMQGLAHRLDPSRPVTFNADLGDRYPGIDEVIQVRGWSYHVGPAMDAYHREHPQQPNVGSEQGSTVGTRGIYANDPVRGYVSAYDDNAPEWAQTAETWVSFFATRPWLSGGFVWTGFDYRGEPTPYGWPCINSHFGIMDTCGFPKDNFWYYQARWVDRPVLHLLPHWNWPGREGQPIDVRAESNCEEVEVSLNGRSLGRQTIKPNSEGKWTVPYAPGILSAHGFRGGRPVVETRVETTGAPAVVRLVPDRATVGANGEDVSVVAVAVADASGRVVPTAGNEISFELEGPGRILGVGNGDPSCHEPDTFVAAPESRSRPVSGWRWKELPSASPPNLPEEGAEFDDSGWAATDASAEEGPLAHGAQGIFRARLTVSAEDLAAPVVELWFARVTGGVGVYLNGQPLGAAVDRAAPSVFDVKGILHPGENSIAVAAANWSELPSGISRGVSLRLQDAPLPVHWRRSVFNGVAQIILQSSREPGALRLTARAGGLEPATLVVPSAPATARPAVP